jgi:uncharacterized protein (DUF924 family)
MDGPADVDEVLAFWREAGRDRWFTSDPSFDETCRGRFLPTFERAAAGELNEWELSATGSLALVLLLDQMSRNLFRGTRRAWATDAAAQLVAERALDRGYDKAVEPELRQFFYLPFMHAEDRAAQERAVKLAETLGDPDTLRWARHHHDIVARFGRFPHRNAVLGRASTAEEEVFLRESEFKG